MNKHAIFLDLDGTALSSHNHLDESIIKTVKQIQEDGHKVFIATGRQFYSALPFHQQLALDTPLITLNGGAIYTKDGKLLHQETLEEDFLDHLFTTKDFSDKTIASYFDALNLTIATSTDKKINEFFYAQMPQQMEPNIAFHNPSLENKEQFADVVSVFSILPKGNLEWASNVLTTYQKANPENTIATRLVEKDIHDNFSYCEYFPQNALKSKGIEWVLEHLNLSNVKTMAFGDGVNDPDMLKFVDQGIAMKNGCDEVFAVANATTASSNVDNGVAEYLTSYFL